jgi:5'-deoxynucleotidase YfbR-like HD superfamily hydrolase
MNSGAEIDIENLSIDDINLEDISHHLTKICRFSGGLNLKHHYSVANHCIALYYYAMDNGLSIEVQRGLLMHDASEAYLGDVNGILKKFLPDYLEVEEMFTTLIETKYNLCTNPMTKEIINQLDKRILLDEVRAFMPHRYDRFKYQCPDLKPLGIKLYPEQELSITKAMFAHCCQQLNIFD